MLQKIIFLSFLYLYLLSAGDFLGAMASESRASGTRTRTRDTRVAMPRIARDEDKDIEIKRPTPELADAEEAEAEIDGLCFGLGGLSFSRSHQDYEQKNPMTIGICEYGQADEPPIGEQKKIERLVEQRCVRKINQLCLDTPSYRKNIIYKYLIRSIKALGQSVIDSYLTDKDCPSQTMLHNAAIHDYTEALQVLILAGASLGIFTVPKPPKSSSKKPMGLTALGLAVKNGHPRCVAILVYMHADMYVCSESLKRRSALDLTHKILKDDDHCRKDLIIKILKAEENRRTSLLGVNKLKYC